MPDIVEAPWTDKQVDNLNRWQTCDHVHEFTCPNNHEASRVLVAEFASNAARGICYRTPARSSNRWARARVTLITD